MTSRWLWAVGAIVVAFALSGQAQHKTNGQELFARRCGGCHAMDRDKEGPRLGGVYGRRAASIEDFSYSDALKRFGVTWNDESLEKWLADPQRLVPENEMSFHVENAGERHEIIAFLKANAH